MTYYQDGKIKDVNAENLTDELRVISDLLEDYNFISMVRIMAKFFIGYRVPWYSIPTESKFPIHE